MLDLKVRMPALRKWRRLEIVLLAGLVLGLLLALTPFRSLSFVVIIVATSCLIPLGKLGIITRAIVGFTVIASINGFIAAIFWIVRWPLTSGVLLIFYSICLIVWLLVKKQNGKIDPIRFNSHEFLSLLTALAAVVVVVWPLFFKDLGPKLAQIVMAGGDNAAHIEMVKTNDLNKGFAYGFERNRVNPSPGTSNYPQTWHFNTAFTKWLVEPLLRTPNSPTKILFIYYMSAVLWFTMLLYCMVRLSLLVAEQISGKISWAAALGAVAVTIPVGTHWLIGLFSNGFHAQNAALLLLAVEAILIIEIFQRSAKERFPLLLLATVCVASINFVWIFLFPIGALPLGIAVVATWWKNNKRLPIYYIICTVLLGLIACIQPVLYKIYPINFEFPWILQRGFITQTSMYTLVFLLVPIAWYVYVYWKHVAVRIIFGFVVASFGFSYWLFNYQLSKIGELRYFYFKSTYTVIIFSAIIVGAILCQLLQILLKQKVRRPVGVYKTSLVLVVIILATMVGWTTRQKVLNSYGDSTIGGISQGQAWEIIHQVAVDPANGLRLGFIGACNRGDDIRSNQLSHALAFVDADRMPSNSFDSGPLDEKLLFRYVGDVASHAQGQIIVVSSDQVISRKLFDTLDEPTKAKIKLINIDTTAETEPVSQCPNRSRDIEAYPIP